MCTMHLFGPTYLALALLNFIDYILMLPYAVSLHKIKTISTGQLSDEKWK